ncbi:protein Lines homolog 1 [Nematolebias whitei]|uniref:protein Lines homolog 1 n=1 Tax=Nematolebias whitei TaxID=451745 RepID=UPI00189B8FFE|nr:protein Lines homolog 1 [Nematolebias whitei]
MAAACSPSSSGELFQVMTDLYQCFTSGFCPEPSCRDVAVQILSGLCGRVPREDTCSSWELTSICVSLLKKLSCSLVLQNLPAESAGLWDEILRVLLEDLDLMSQLVQLLQAEDQLISHLAAKTVSLCVLYRFRKSGEVCPIWQETCVQAFCSSCPVAELDACLWSLTEVLKKLLKGSNPAIVGRLVSSFDLSLRTLCSKLLPEASSCWVGFTFRRSWETTFCLLLDLLEVLTASRLIVGPEFCQRPLQVRFSALLTTISCCTQDFVKNRTLLFLKRLLLQKVGDDWSLGGPRSEDLNSDLRVLSQSVLAAVADGWLQTVQVEPGGFFGGTRPVRGDEGPKPDGVMFRAVSLVLLKSTELQFQTLDAAGVDSVSEVCGYVHRLWDFLNRFSRSLRVDHLCCWVHLLFEEQDDDLMEALRTCLSLFLISRRCSGLDADDVTELKRACDSGFNPHCHFVLLLQSFSFDHTVLLDFLISSETCFLEYFVRYLKFLRGSWPGFTAACGSRTSGSEHVHLLEELSSGARLRLVEYDSSDESGSEPAEDFSVGEERPVSVEAASKSPSESSRPAEPSLQSQQTCPGEHPLLRQVGSETMDRAVLCLWDLRQAVTRLQKKELFPYNASSLLKLLAQVETSSRRFRPVV